MIYLCLLLYQYFCLCSIIIHLYNSNELSERKRRPRVTRKAIKIIQKESLSPNYHGSAFSCTQSLRWSLYVGVSLRCHWITCIQKCYLSLSQLCIGKLRNSAYDAWSNPSTSIPLCLKSHFVKVI